MGLLVHNTCTMIGRMEDLKVFDDIPADIIDTWRKTGRMPGPGERIGWVENKRWLLERVARGDSFGLVTDPSTLPKVLGGYIDGVPNGYFTAKELDLLKSLGIDVMELW